MTNAAGVASNGVPFVVIVPPSISAFASPAPNSAGWNNSNVTVSFTCTAGSAAITSCPAPKIVSSEGVNQVVSGTTTDANGLMATVSVTLNIDKTPPVLAAISPTDGTILSTATATVTGSVSDALSGLSSVTCDQIPASFVSGTFSCNISLNIGVNLVVVRATDIAGNVAGSNFHVSLTGTLPAPNSLQISPGTVNMLVGDTQQFTVTDDQYQSRSDATWTVSDPTLASITSDASPILTALAVGQVTLTANVGGLSAQVQVNILGGTALPPGTVRWSVPPLYAGGAMESVLQAAPVQGAPDLFVLERTVGSDGSVGDGVRALTADGRSMGTPFGIVNSNGSTIGMGTADANGGILATLQSALGCPPGASSIEDHDGQTGSMIWVTFVDYDCQTPSFAVGPEGHVYFRDVYHHSLIILDGNTGAQIGGYDAPNTTTTDGSGDVFTFPGQVSDPTVGPDGTVYAQVVQYGTQVGSIAGTWILAMSPNGVANLTQIPASIAGSLVPGKVIPDGQGSAYAVWQELDDPAAGTIHVSHGASDSPVPLADVPDEVVLDENGVLYASVNSSQGTITALAGGTGLLWSYSTAPSDSIHLVCALTGAGGANIVDQQQGLIPLDTSGNPGTPSGSPFFTPISFAPSIVLPFALGNWLGPVSGAFSMFTGTSTSCAASSYPRHAGNGQGQKSSPRPVIAHFIPVDITALGISPADALAGIKGSTGPPVAVHEGFLLSNATVQNFTETLAKPLAAVGFIGHSIFAGDGQTTPFYSVGLSFFGGQVLVPPPNSNPPFPVPQYVNSVVTNGIKTQTKVVFIGACFIGPTFQALWNINNQTVGQAMLVPTNPNSEANLGHAVFAWTRILDDMLLSKMTVGAAVQETNQYLSTLHDVNGNPIPERWQVVGDPNVTIK